MRILRRLPIAINSSPESFKPSKYFQKLCLHETENLILFNLENQIQIVPYGLAEFRVNTFEVKSLITATTIANGKLKDIIIYSDFASKLNLRHFESKSVSRSWNLPKDQTSSHIKIKEEIIYCGLTDGRVVLYDLRMKTPLSILQEPDDVSSLNKFDPVTSIENWDDYKLMSASSSKICIWDLRSTKVVTDLPAKFNKIPKACMINPVITQVAFYMDNSLQLYSLENKDKVEIKMENQIEDILYIPKLNELLILTSSIEADGFVKGHTYVYSVANALPELIDKLDMTEDYSQLLFSEYSNMLIAAGNIK
jgi:WD40 repeat protein